MSHLKYRREIDGLRAIAILPVIWLHAGLPYISGGFFGVDVFFVISGFLITSILLKEMENHSFSVMSFYERRARRILPALITVLIFTAAITPIVTSHPKYLADLGTSIVATSLFSSNFLFWQTSGYFGSTSELSPLLHTWSLAVEEQYYIFFPLLLLVIFPKGKKHVAGVLVTLSIISLAGAQWASSNHAIGNFYLLPSRIWELLAGALAAIFIGTSLNGRIPDTIKSLLGMAGLVLIAYAYLFFTPATPHPALPTVLPVIGAVMILLFASQNNITGKLLSLKPAVAVGLISYSLYLWHQPILALLKTEYGLHLPLRVIILAIFSTFILSYVTWKFVENPLRDRTKYSPGRIAKFSVLAMSAGLLSGLLLQQNTLIQRYFSPQDMLRFDQLVKAEESHLNQKMYDDGACKYWSDELNEIFVKRFEQCSRDYGKATFILGGSHGMDLYNAVAMNSHSPFVVSVSRGFCRIHDFIGSKPKGIRCQYNDFIEFTETHGHQLSTVIYTQTPDRLFDVDFEQARITDISSDSVEKVVDYLKDLSANNPFKVVMLGMLPPLIKKPIDWNYQQPFGQQWDQIVSQHNISLTNDIDKHFQQQFADTKIIYIPKIYAFSLSLPDDLVLNTGISYSDNRHISTTGELAFGKRMVKKLQKEFKLNL